MGSPAAPGAAKQLRWAPSLLLSFKPAISPRMRLSIDHTHSLASDEHVLTVRIALPAPLTTQRVPPPILQPYDDVFSYLTRLAFWTSSLEPHEQMLEVEGSPVAHQTVETQEDRQAQGLPEPTRPGYPTMDPPQPEPAD